MTVGFGINSYRGDTHLAKGTNDPARNGATVCNQNLAKHYFSTPFQISTWTGVGLYAVQGLFNWGQLLISASTSVSARISTYLPGSEMPSSHVRLPSGVTGAFMKKLMLLVISRLDMPWSDSIKAFRKLLRQACMCLF